MIHPAMRLRANSIIGKLCAASYRAANFSMRAKRKKHRPYNVPEIAARMIDALNADDGLLLSALLQEYNGLQLMNAVEVEAAVESTRAWILSRG